jgi:2-polyprenyl-6-methoxyphenol hydroxylase-like FAD-dependent oxidoreductase
VTFSQPHLLEHLVELAGRSPSFQLVRGGTVRDLHEEDGRASIVRRHGGFSIEERGAPMDDVTS